MPTPKTIIVPVSGGKDSQAVLSLALAQSPAGTNIVCVHQDTGYDHPDTYAHLRTMEHFYKIPIEFTRNQWGGMFGFLASAGYFPNSAARGCTQRLKQAPFARWLRRHHYTPDNCQIWFGMREDESARRSAKYGGLSPDDLFPLKDISAYYRRGKLGDIPCRLPIVDWTTEQVFQHLKQENAPLNPLYAKGHHRVGCYPCLLARKAEWIAAAKDPVGRQHIQRLIILEDKWAREGNPRKFIKVHRVWDVRKFLTDNADALPEAKEECGYCSI